MGLMRELGGNAPFLIEYLPCTFPPIKFILIVVVEFAWCMTGVNYKGIYFAQHLGKYKKKNPHFLSIWKQIKLFELESMPSVQQVLYVYILSNQTLKQMLITIFNSVENSALRMYIVFAMKRA